MYKFFISQKQIDGETATITGEDVNHIVNVLRLKQPDKIILCNKVEGKSYISEIMQIEKSYIICKILEMVSETTESNVNIDLFQGLPKADKMEYIIQKATEIGVKNIYPVNLERCIVKLDSKSEAKKIDRWQKIAEVASKQSKRDVIPNINNVINIKNICQNAKKYDIILIAYENEEKNTLKNELQKLKNNKLNKDIIEISSNANCKSDSTEKLKIGIVIGPEGGLSENEVAELMEAGAKSVSLGKRILRTETAPLVMISDIIYEFDL